ncbi:predicted protein [Sclerotinia sclerotiorum 1980 UF-70]|uniref:Uncharacterized protein n=1 Tax=Sclerotinia sclerotiorum (strain ATCC 18683 / 1980 / Ss-1) TaxID=665079 RepID=A7EVH2_SCLS1|nr:predicted protein [Sclerotinia sclerotiorum 1980 UF-70]EDN93464.1 predicted protein [Sclerotinia sclerotiorum 1980 UF-70]
MAISEIKFYGKLNCPLTIVMSLWKHIRLLSGHHSPLEDSKITEVFRDPQISYTSVSLENGQRGKLLSNWKILVIEGQNFIMEYIF